MNDERAVSEMISVVLIIFLVIAMAALVFLLSSGVLSNLTKPTFIAPKISAQTISGKNTIDLFNRGGDTLYLNVPHLHYNEMGVFIDTPQGSFRARPLPGVDQFSPGTRLYIFKEPDAYRITDNPADLASPSAQSVPAGNVGVRLVDENSQMLIAQWEGNAGISPSPTPVPTTVPTTIPITVPTTVPTTVVTTVPHTTVSPTTIPTTAKPTPAPTESPGFGAPLALAGLGAVVFISVRRYADAGS
jgi:PGF-CTERM protein